MDSSVMPGIRRRSASENMRIGVIISDEPRINDEIRVSQVRLIGPNGEQVGVLSLIHISEPTRH